MPRFTRMPEKEQSWGWARLISTAIALIVLCGPAASGAATRARTLAEPRLSDPSVRLSSGGSHTCHVKDDATIRCWGGNFSGQLGDGTTTNRSTPVTVGGFAGAVAVAAGSNHTCALLADGTARCWGSNGVGQLGDGTVTNRRTRVIVRTLGNAVAITAAGDHSCALLADGTARCWGTQGGGALGNGQTSGHATTPVGVSTLPTATAMASTCAVRSARR